MGARRRQRRGLLSRRATRLAARTGSAAALAGLTLLLLTISSPGTSLPGGPPASALNDGCSCHSATPSKNVLAAIGGVPAYFEKSHAYPLRVSIEGGPEPNPAPEARQGGFILGVSQGTLAPIGQDVQVKTESAQVKIDSLEIAIVVYAEQTEAGNQQRTWELTWTSPASPQGRTYFVLVVNSVNGKDANRGDEWARTLAVSAGPGEPTAEVPIHEMGVQLMAYWLGVGGFFIIFGVIGFSFVLIRKMSQHYKFPEVPQGARRVKKR